MAQQPAGWYTDPTSKYNYRYWSGTQWSNQVSTGGSTGTDPDPMDPNAVGAPPAPGTAAPAPPQQQPATTVQVTQKRGSAFGTIIGVVLAIIAIVVLIVILMNISGDDTTDSTVAPATTEAPAPTTTAGG
jgi:hypothetical protein